MTTGAPVGQVSIDLEGRVAVARLVRWLASDDSGWITGQTIDSEGGFAAG